ncbi:MAG: DUF4365 domain-containing protein [Phycisphaeraceae bacterium]
MQRSPQHEIDEAAQRTFQGALPSAWVARPQHPDYGIDYLVEVAADGQMTGQTFAVQLKGTRQLRLVNGTVRFALSSKHLAYYVDCCRQPVFLVVVDVTNERCYWLFLQQYALEAVAQRPWRDQQRVTVHIPETQKIHDHEQLQNSVAEAERYMIALQPAALATAVDAEKRRYESLDPRFAVTVRTDGDQTHYRVNAKQTVQFNLHLTGAPERMQQAIENLIERGLPVDLSELDVKVDGSPLIEKIVGTAATMQHQKSIEARLEVCAVADDREVARLDTIVGILAGGPKEMRFAGTLPESPLSIRFPLALDETEDRGSITMDFGFRVEEWTGQRIRHLAYFDPLYELFTAVQQGALLFIRCTSKGRPLFTGHAMRDALGFVEMAAQLLEHLRQARAIAQACDVNPVMPESLTEEDVDWIAEIYWRFRDQEVRQLGETTEVTTIFSREGAEQLLQKQSERKVANLKATVGPEDAALFGAPIQLPPGEIVLTKAQLPSSLEDVETALADPAAKTVLVRWKGTEGSEFIKRPLPPQ